MSHAGRSTVQQLIKQVLDARPTLPQQVDHDIAAVVTVEQDMRFFPLTLRSLVAQSVLPGTIVVADCSGSTAQPMHTELKITAPISDSHVLDTDVTEHGSHSLEVVDIQVVRAKGAVSFGDAVSRGLQYARLNSRIRALWLLHDDSRPADVNCLETLREAWRNAPTASLLGAKQLDWDGELLHEVGAYSARHSIARLVVDGEPDQEQYDTRQDVFEVDLAGALLPIDTLHALDGFTPWFGAYAESWDFSRRICRSGGRVVVVPQARIAHRRARFEGIRSHAGEPIDEQEREHTTMSMLKARWRYRFTDVSFALWPILWLVSLPLSIIRAVRRLFAKQPWDAWCELCIPWLALAGVPAALKARRKVARHSVVPSAQLSAVVADRGQLKQWRQRRQVMDSQHNTVLLSPLAIAHLRTRALKRWTAAIVMAVGSFAVVLIAYWQVFRGLTAGGSISSGLLAASAADYRQLAQVASTPWAYGVDTGYPAPPAPFLLIWLVASTLTIGHVNAGLGLLFFAAAPASALSFWSLAGIFTRSNAVRVICGLLWASLGATMGLYRTGNIPMLMVMVFVPAAFAYAFRATGLYHTDDPARPHPSTQSAACAALAFIPVITAEPQLLLPLFAIFIVFMIFVPKHRVMLLLIPVPAAFAVAPTAVNALRYAANGAPRQLFGDITIATQSSNGEPAALEFTGLARRAFDLNLDLSVWSISNSWQIGMVVSLLLITALAAAALFLPSALRVSRLMWGVVLAGILTAMVSARVIVAVDEHGAVAGSVLPGVTLAMLGLLACVSQVAGSAVKRFNPLAASSVGQGKAAGVTAMRAWRSVLVILLAFASAAWLGFGYNRNESQTITTSSHSLPMVATDYLEQDSSRRILALYAQTQTTVRYSVMRTGRGDLIDSSPAMRARIASTSLGSEHDELAQVAAKLLANGDPEAVDTLANRGFGGIYVVTDLPGTDSAQASNLEAASELLITNIGTSDTVQEVVSNREGTYLRLISSNAEVTGINTQEQQQVETGVWRHVWLWSLSVIIGLYCLVALPRSRRTKVMSS